MTHPATPHVHVHTHLHTHLHRSALALLALCAAPAALAEPLDPQQTQTCNEPPPLSPPWAGGAGRVHAQLSGRPLKPGSSRRTRGTNPGESPELSGWVVFSADRNYSFTSGGQQVAGSYGEVIVQGSDDTCKSHIQLRPTQGCVARIAIHGWRQKTPLVADHRDDLAGQVAPREASRSPKPGTVITFELKEPVCAPKVSRWLLLNTSLPALAPADTLVLHADSGGSSFPLPLHGPLAAD